MRQLLFAIPLAALAFAGLTPNAQAEELKKSRGTLIAMSADSITLKVGTTELKFGIDSTTHVEAPGAGTKARRAAAAGKPGPKLTDVLAVGQAVEVSYDAARHADSIRKVSSPGSGGVPDRVSEGKVVAISSTSMSINGSSGGGTFSQTFVIDDKTKVTAKGASTALANAGGRGPATAVISKGDSVSVAFDEAGGSLRAADIRVTAKAK